MSCFCFINYLNNNLTLYSKNKSNFNINDFLTKNRSFIQFPKAQGDVILQDVEGNIIEVDGVVTLSSVNNSKPLITNNSNIVESSIITNNELNGLSGTTSNIQDDLNKRPYVYNDIPIIQSQPKILFGVVVTSSSLAVTVLFDPPFNTTPVIQVVINSDNVNVPLVTNRTATGFDIESITSNGVRSTRTYRWIAIGN
jgi:hypothetical protein